MVSRISAKGQITVPKKLRDNLGLRPADYVSYELGDGCIILRRVEPFDAEYHAALSATLSEWTSPDDDDAFRDL